MKLIIRDAWIRHGKLDVVRGAEQVVFERCTFMGGTVRIDPDIDAKIFVDCLFEGTCFTAQTLCPRIASNCHWEPPNIEDAMPSAGLLRATD
jgi:hypothetical protein